MYVSDHVEICDVAVVADTYWHALKARKTLKIDWDLGPGANLSTAAFWKGTMDAEKTVAPIKMRPDVGDAAGAIKGAKKVLKAVYQTGLMAHQPLEPMNMIVSSVWCSPRLITRSGIMVFLCCATR
jgi:isoquinoline 1-oxidoreductase beta subunit